MPEAGLILDGADNLYGTTSNGGAFGDGTVFTVDSAGNETVLYSFAGKTDGWSPLAGIVLDKAGGLYGTAALGGLSGFGVVFELKRGRLDVLHAFTGGADGALPESDLIRDNNGNLYGTTLMGGDAACRAPYGCGVVFMLDKIGKETVLHAFKGGRDGALPMAGLIRDEMGILYGTTCGEGDADAGTVFKLDRTSKETVLYRFDGKTGACPYQAGVIRDGAGNLYGTATVGGAFTSGTVFKITS